MRTANPTLGAGAFSGERALVGAERMTVDGTVNRTGFLLMLAIVSAAWPWHLYSRTLSPETPFGDPGVVMVWMIAGAIGGLIAAIVTSFKHAWSPVSAPVYAVLEGLFLGSISAIFEVRYPGILVQAVGLTLGTLLALLAAYKSGVIKVSDKFRRGVVAATGGIFLFYMASWVLGFFGVQMPLIHSSGTFGIVFSLAVIGIAAMNLVLDFDFIERGAAQGAPRYMEWYGAFGLMVTLVWLYVEILRLLSKLRDRR